MHFTLKSWVENIMFDIEKRKANTLFESRGNNVRIYD